MCELEIVEATVTYGAGPLGSLSEKQLKAQTVQKEELQHRLVRHRL